MVLIKLLLLSLILGGCQISSIDDVKKESHKLSKEMIAMLKEIKDSDELLSKRALLKKYYEQFAKLMVKAQSFYVPEEEKEQLLLSEPLRDELARIYRLEKGKEIMEECQQGALHYLSKHL
jgi:hypothetical protein